IRDSSVTGVQTCALPILERLQKRSKGVVYRLVGVGGGGADVVAKWSSAERIARESVIYEEVLPAAATSCVRYYGTLDDPDAGGSDRKRVVQGSGGGGRRQ